MQFSSGNIFILPVEDIKTQYYIVLLHKILLFSENVRFGGAWI